MKKLKDERITRETNKITSKMFWVISALLAVLLIGKLTVGVEWHQMLLEILCFVVSGGYVLVEKLRKGAMKIGTKDSVMREIKEAIYGKAFMITFYIMIFGELVLMLLGEDVKILAWYLAVWFIPALVVSVYSIRHGLLLWGGQKRQAAGNKDLAKRVVVGALVYGLIMGAPMLFRDGQFQPSGILWILGMAAGWGIPFYFIFRLLINKGEKRANQQVSEVENGEE